MTSSMLYTMGLALDRAHQSGFGVSLLVEGVWLEGQVAANDGTGVVLETHDGHAVVRIERISVVKVHAESPYRARITDGPLAEAMPMPGRRGEPAYAAAS